MKKQKSNVGEPKGRPTDHRPFPWTMMGMLSLFAAVIFWGLTLWKPDLWGFLHASTYTVAAILFFAGARRRKSC